MLMTTFERIGETLLPAHPRALRSLTSLALCALPLILLGLLGSTQATAKTLKIATLMPEGSGFVTEMRQAGKNIDSRTEGRVRLKFYPGGVMGNDKTVMRKMRIGQIHGAALPSGPLASVFPDIEIYSLPLFFRDYGEVEHVREHIDKKLKAGLTDAGFTTLAISDGGFAYLFSRSAIQSVEDLPKSKIWIPEDDIMSQTALELAGASPIPLPTADVYTALQTGLIDTVAAPPMGAIAFQWHTKVRTMTNVPLMYLIGIFTIDSKAFNKLRQEDQEVLREEIVDASRRLDRATRQGDVDALAALKNQGIDVVMVSSTDELERWHEISIRAMDRLRKSNRYSNDLLDEMIQLVDAYREKNPAVVTDSQAQAAPATPPSPSK
jgi:TRAP-type C4-dicarboxylate transport system substrate-binding protein